MKNRAKKILKKRIQKDWLIAFVLTFTFFMQYLFGAIDWNWYWLVCPIWILVLIYSFCTLAGMTWYFLINKKKIKDDYELKSLGKGVKFSCSCMGTYPPNCNCGKFDLND